MLFEMPHNQEMLVLAWGEGQHGQLGFRPDSTMQKIMPGAIEALAKLQVTKVGAGGNSSWALTADGKLYTWGDNSHQQLGLGAAHRHTERVFAPTLVSPTWETSSMQMRPVTFVHAVMHRRHAGGIDDAGVAYTWGHNSMGQLGHGDRVAKNLPTRVLKLTSAVSLALGMSHSAAVDSHHHLWTWGDLGEGRLGHGVQYSEEKVMHDGIPSRERHKLDFLVEPRRVDFLRVRHSHVAAVACGDRFTVAVDRRGHLWSWVLPASPCPVLPALAAARDDTVCHLAATPGCRHLRAARPRRRPPPLRLPRAVPPHPRRCPALPRAGPRCPALTAAHARGAGSRMSRALRIALQPLDMRSRRSSCGAPAR